MWATSMFIAYRQWQGRLTVQECMIALHPNALGQASPLTEGFHDVAVHVQHGFARLSQLTASWE